MDGRQDCAGSVGDDLEVSVSPSGDVADAVVGGVESEQSGQDVGDGFGFDFGAASVQLCGVNVSAGVA
ncbi:MULTISPECIES: hypothetical protein [unclassified Rhodococcus (in: high G+C Gram-positive bacteria)]|uniref:hypothetical protein n=1 Tax=unclassified Rhodococcus (in: high G+C Gram-positive bacteria) TaxID=192944 RepID=UPI001E5C52DA|nr:hypothetical protein [Rhodococcus sp. JT-3]